MWEYVKYWNDTIKNDDVTHFAQMHEKASDGVLTGCDKNVLSLGYAVGNDLVHVVGYRALHTVLVMARCRVVRYCEVRECKIR